MKRNLSLMVLAFTFGISECPPTSMELEVDAELNCGSTSSAVKAVSLTLEPGSYEATATGGAATQWSDQHAWYYFMKISVLDSGFETWLGDYNDQYPTYAQAEEAALGESVTFQVFHTSEVLFWFHDTDCSDNAGILYAELTALP